MFKQKISFSLVKIANSLYNEIIIFPGVYKWNKIQKYQCTMFF